MPLLTERQARFLAALHNGPELLDASDFATAGDRLLLAMKAHANTVSHARMTALEDSFPRTRVALGQGAFHELTREFTLGEAAKAAPLALIGATFAPWLADHVTDASLIDLARIEWAWLEVYHAEEARALMLPDLAGLAPEEILHVAVCLHPAARLVPLFAPVHRELGELAAHRDAAALLVTRPEAEVRLSPIDGATARLFDRAGKCATLGALFDAAADCAEDDMDGDAVLTMIGAGAFMVPG